MKKIYKVLLAIILPLILFSSITCGAYADVIERKLLQGDSAYVLIGDNGVNLTLTNAKEDSQWYVADKSKLLFENSVLSGNSETANFIIKTLGETKIACINEGDYFNFNINIIDKVEKVNINSSISYPKIGDTVIYTAIFDDKSGFMNAVWYLDGEEVFRGSNFTYKIKSETDYKLTVKYGGIEADTVIKPKTNIFGFLKGTVYGRIIAILFLGGVAIVMLFVRKRKPSLQKYSVDSFKKIEDNIKILCVEIDKEDNQKRIYKYFNAIELTVYNLTNLLLQENEIKTNEFDNLLTSFQHKQCVFSTAKRKYKKLDKQMLKQFFENNIKDFKELQCTFSNFYLNKKMGSIEKLRDRGVNDESLKKSVFRGFDLKYRDTDKFFFDEYKAAVLECKAKSEMENN